MIPPPVKRVALDAGLQVLQPENASEPAFCREIKELAPDLVVVVAFGQILKKPFLEIPPWGVLNVHASLLPKYRGAAPIQWAILNDEAETGLSAMRMDEGMDTGPVLLQHRVKILENETAGGLHDRLCRLSGEFLLTTIEGLAKNKLKERPQDPREASYAPKIDREAARIQWDRPAALVCAQIRAMDPWPGAYTTLEGKEIKLFSSRVYHGVYPDAVPGRIGEKREGAVCVETAGGAVEIGALQVAGKKRLSAMDFLRGFVLDRGSVLGT
jgi:methionyl-tRNA formyltransferase